MERLTPVLTFFACCITAWISNNFAADTVFSQVIWPPVGIAIAGLALEKKHTIWVIFIAALISRYNPPMTPAWLSLFIATTETLAAYYGVIALKQMTDFDWSFGSTTHVFHFLTRVALPASFIPPLICAPAMYLGHLTRDISLGEVFFTWWSGNLLGIIIFVPFIMIVAKNHVFATFQNKWAEFVVLNAICIMVCVYLFVDIGVVSSWMPQVFRRIYMLFPVVLWVALRFGPFGVSVILLQVSSMVTYGANVRSFVFASPLIYETFNSAQMYIIFLAATGHLVAAHMTLTKRNELQFRSMFEMAGVPAILVDRAGRLKLINEQFCCLTGYSCSELESKTLYELLHPEDLAESQRIFSRLHNRRETSIHFEKRLLTRNQDIIWCLVDATLINHLGQPETVSIAMLQDITVRKINLLATENAKQQAEKENLAKSEFLAFMSHEIRTPLGVILGFSELLKNKDLDATLRIEFVDTIHRNAIELGALIDDVLDLSKVAAGRNDLAPDHVIVAQLMRDMTETFSLQTLQKHIHFDVTVDPDVPDVIICDSKRLRQVLVNVISNAVKYTEKGWISLKVNKEQNKDILSFTISDSGLGMSQSQIDQLFKPFSRAHCSQRKHIRGTGLGLVLSRKLAGLMGGDVVLLTSQPGLGSSFKVTISFDRPPVHIKKLQASSVTAPHPSVKGLHILVAEDTPDQALLIKLLLTDIGAIVDLTDNGSSAVEKSLKHDYDLVFMDMQMPILDGLSATRLLRRQNFRKPIIALTAQAMQEDRDKALQAGCNEHLSKPFTKARLVQAIANVMPNRCVR